MGRTKSSPEDFSLSQKASCRSFLYRTGMQFVKPAGHQQAQLFTNVAYKGKVLKFPVSIIIFLFFILKSDLYLHVIKIKILLKNLSTDLLFKNKCSTQPNFR